MTTQTKEMFRMIGKCPCGGAVALDVGNLNDVREIHNRIGGWGEPVRCSCGRRIARMFSVEGRFSDARKCDDRCTSARGHDCECQCGGRNHGEGWS